MINTRTVAWFSGAEELLVNWARREPADAVPHVKRPCGSFQTQDALQFCDSEGMLPAHAYDYV